LRVSDSSEVIIPVSLLFVPILCYFYHFNLVLRIILNLLLLTFWNAFISSWSNSWNLMSDLDSWFFNVIVLGKFFWFKLEVFYCAKFGIAHKHKNFGKVWLGKLNPIIFWLVNNHFGSSIMQCTLNILEPICIVRVSQNVVVMHTNHILALSFLSSFELNPLFLCEDFHTV